MSKHIGRYRRIVTKINKLEKEMEGLQDGDFEAKTSLLKMRLKAGDNLDKILPEAFALVREVAKRVLGLRAFNVQLQGAIAAHEGHIVEMKTGEGKTLAIAFPAYLNALEAKGVHVVTANDYLADRDAKWMGRVYSMLGLSVGAVTGKTDEIERQISYNADITYVTNDEVGFDFLKDNMLYENSGKRQRDLYYSIVDEADSVLIDEAQIPLVIADEQETPLEDKEIFVKLNPIIGKLRKKSDFAVDKKERTVELTQEGIEKLEKMLNVKNLYEEDTVDYIYFIEQLLKGHNLFTKDKDYVVENGEVVIVDEFTGRLLPDHRYYQGIHQAIEAKEGLAIRDETKTLASITFQHLFRKYTKMAGLTGTAVSSKKEFRMIYGKEVVEIPTDKRIARIDQPDRFFLRWEDKIKYLGWTVKEHYFKKRAILVGTRSVRKSNEISTQLISENIPSSVLNAKHTIREAELIAVAGRPQSVTVATNMAGRGTDIELEESVKKDLGLIVFGLERHNAKRIDDQLIGRAGRQGDPGLSQFLISADDELIRTHFQEEFVEQLKKYKDWHEGVESAAMGKIIKRAQNRMEEVFFDQRVLSYEFDKVLEAQRNSFYRQRSRVLWDDNLKEETLGLVSKEAYRRVIASYKGRKEMIGEKEIQQVVSGMKKMVLNEWFRPEGKLKPGIDVIALRKLVFESVSGYYEDFEKYVSEKKMRMIEKTVTLKALDVLWIQHLQKVEQLQEAAIISSIGKSDFFEEYEIEMSKVYRQMLFSAPRVIVLTLFRTMNRIMKGGTATKKV